jgi:hypothetical protein
VLHAGLVLVLHAGLVLVLHAGLVLVLHAGLVLMLHAGLVLMLHGRLVLMLHGRLVLMLHAGLVLRNAVSSHDCPLLILTPVSQEERLPRMSVLSSVPAGSAIPVNYRLRRSGPGS